MRPAQPKFDLDALFCEAIALSDAAERKAFLEQACRGDSQQRQHLEKLVAAHFQAGDFLQKPVDGSDVMQAVADEWLHFDRAKSLEGSLIGPYKIRELLGEGGMGSVYLAEQEQPVRRKVALKVIKPGMDCLQVIARFEAERQALAMMDHPHIARVLDAGTTDADELGSFSKLPYFVMELVKGMPITAHCDAEQLPVRQRLELFLQVCRAVQHAHQKGIIHRDLKPSNILVARHDTTPMVKVIDFGVAKALEAKLATQTVYTGFHQLLGTPTYMSPEQAGQSSLDIDTRSDIYSLGVLLYELLTGHTPFAGDLLASRQVDEIRRVIREEEPHRPSQRISTLQADAGSTVAHSRGVDQRQLVRELRGELDWIVMMCLEKDRNRRYESASALALDIQRYLQQEPIAAGPPTFRYRLRKLVRRHRVLVVAASTGFLLLFLLAGGVGWVAHERGSRQQLAESMVREALELGEPLLRSGNPNDPELISAVRKAESQLVDRMVGPELERRVIQMRADREMLLQLEQARLARTAVSGNAYDLQAGADAYASAFREYGLDVQKLSTDEAIKRLRDSNIGADLGAAIQDWTSVLRQLDRIDDAKRLAAISRRLHTDDWSKRLYAAFGSRDQAAITQLAQEASVESWPVATIISFADVLLDGPFQTEAVNLLRRAQPRHPHNFWINHELGRALVQSTPSQPQEAIVYFRIAVALRPESPGARLNLGYALNESGRLDEAIFEYQAAVHLKPDFVGARNNLAGVLLHRGRPKDALVHLREGIRLSPNSIWLHITLGHCLRELGQTDEALRAFQEAHRIDPELISVYADLKGMLEEQGRFDEALELARKALAMQEKLVADAPLDLGRRHQLAGAQNNLAILLRKRGEPKQAEALLRQAIKTESDLLAQSPGTRDYVDFLANMHHNLARLLQSREVLDEAERAYLEALALRKQLSAEMPEYVGYQDRLTNVQSDWAYLLTSQKRYEEAIPLWQEVIQRHPLVDHAHTRLGESLFYTGRLDEALVAFQEAIRLNPNSTLPYVGIGDILYQRKQLPEAVGQMRQVFPILQSQLAESPDDAELRHELAGLLYNTAIILTELKKPDEAEPMLRQAIELEAPLLSKSPTDRNILQYLGNMHVNLGELLLHQDRYGEAEVELQKSLAHRQQLVLQVSGSADYRFDLSQVQMLLAKVLIAQKQLKRGKEHANSAIAILDRLAGEFPSEEQYSQSLDECQAILVQSEN